MYEKQYRGKYTVGYRILLEHRNNEYRKIKVKSVRLRLGNIQYLDMVILLPFCY
jgi:hypothetical protein